MYFQKRQTIGWKGREGKGREGKGREELREGFRREIKGDLGRGDSLRKL